MSTSPEGTTEESAEFNHRGTETLRGKLQTSKIKFQRSLKTQRPEITKETTKIPKEVSAKL
jgi:hypothetical protein